MGKRAPAVALSCLLVLTAIVAMTWRGFNFGLDFTGGTLLEVTFAEPVTPDVVRTALRDAGQPDAVVQNVGTERELLVRLRSGAVGDESRLTDITMAALREAFPGVEQKRAEFVGPVVGEELRESGGLAMIAALAVICIYVMWRFTGKFAIAAVIALIHDVIITVGAFAVFAWTVDLAVLAAVLSVIGYSINDTIVICDRIRENMRRNRRSTTFEAINLSLNQTLERTLIMSGTTLLVLVTLLLVSGESLRGFAAALTIGVVVGTWSSIYVAAAYLLWSKLSREDLVHAEADAGEEPRSTP
jgi:preprotein translocase subunit SecF